MRKKAPTIQTERLRLRAFTPGDVPALFDILQQPEIMRYFPNPLTPDRKRVERIVDNVILHWEAHGYGWWALEPLELKELIGWCGLTYLPETGETEVAYLLSQAYWGRGLMPEAARASLEFGFERIGLKRIIALTHPENQRSQRVALKIGMTYLDTRLYFGMECFRFEAFQPGR
jgi:ribosomal-protein-alanine N-acetyltransferase